jgi:NADPH-dependent curcumin reductase CurA
MKEPHIPPFSLPASNRRVLLAKRPLSIPKADDFELDKAAVPTPTEGEFLVRNIYLSVDPAQRGWAQSAANYSEPVALGSPMRALAVGQVVDSRNHEVTTGQYVYGWFNWQDYCIARPEHLLSRIDPELAVPLSCYVGLLGINGVTAYLALTSLGRPKAGETVLVSTAAGAVGSLVGQIAHNLGCRVIGLTGSDDKVAIALDRYGYDFAYNYKSADLDKVLAEAAPDGIDVFFDNTGGSILDTALRRMAIGGRVIQCGTAAIPNWEPIPTGLRNEREVLTRRLIWSGFVIFDHMAGWQKAIRTLADWLQKGVLNYDESITSDIEDAPFAIDDLYQGKNRGKRLIYIG